MKYNSLLKIKAVVFGLYPSMCLVGASSDVYELL